MNGVYPLLADTSAKLKPRSNDIKMLTGFEQDSPGADEAQPAKPGNVLVLPSEAEVEQHASAVQKLVQTLCTCKEQGESAS